MLANHNLSQVVDLRRSLNAVAAGTSEQTGTGIDTLGYDGVLFVFGFGAITSGAVTTIKAQQSSDDGSADDYGDLLGTSQAIADTDDNKIAAIDIYRPLKRYVRPVVGRGTQNAVIDGVIAILYRGNISPAAVHTTLVRAAERFNSPAEGTA
jgi:hypothetical protein